MKKNIKVSIITVCYNSEKTIEETIESVLNQTYKNIEYIIKDGKSKDNTLKIAEKYKKAFNGKLKIISSKDKGLYDAMNEAINMATGDIIGIINSDDVLAKPNVIEKIVNTIVEKNADGVYSNLVLMDETMTRPQRNFIAHHPKKFGWHPPHPTLYLKKSIYNKVGIFNTKFKIAADYDFMLRLFKNNSYKICYINDYLVKMRGGGCSTDGLKGYINSLQESDKVLRHNKIKFPIICNILRIIKTFLQGFSAKINNKKILKKLEKI